jgi:hypothetical protein
MCFLPWQRTEVDPVPEETRGKSMTPHTSNESKLAKTKIKKRYIARPGRAVE